MMKRIFLLTVLFFLFAKTMQVTAQTDTEACTAGEAKNWFSNKVWLGGWQAQPDKTINQTVFCRQYHSNKEYWDKAFAWLKGKDLQTLPPGKYPIDGENVFASVTQNPTKDYDSTKWESHRNYIDVHFVISGEEKIGIYPIAKLTVTNAYDGSKDAANYSGTGKVYSAKPGTFFIFFPSDGHRPGITPGGNKADKKIVIKIRYTNG